MDIDFFWTPAGRAAADANGITFAQVVAVIAADTTVHVFTPDMTRVMLLGGQPARVIVVTLDRPYRTVAVYEITDVRRATVKEALAWEKRQK